jgi:hypothetical protein
MNRNSDLRGCDDRSARSGAARHRAAPGAPGDNILGGPPLTTVASTTCSDSAFATGVSGSLGSIGRNDDIAGSLRMECAGGASGIGTMGNGAGSPRDSLCDNGEVAVGIEGSEGDFIDFISVRCQADTSSGPIVADAGFGGARGSFDGPYDCPTDQALTGFTGTVTDDGVYVRNVAIQCAARADTTTTLAVKTTNKKVKVDGSVDPNQDGTRMTITLFEKKGGKFKKVDQAKPKLNASSEFSSSFDRPGSNSCKVKGQFPGDADANPSSANEKFSC